MVDAPPLRLNLDLDPNSKRISNFSCKIGHSKLCWIVYILPIFNIYFTCFCFAAEFGRVWSDWSSFESLALISLFGVSLISVISWTGEISGIWFSSLRLVVSNLSQLDLDLSDLLDIELSSSAIYRESICFTFWKWTLFPESTEVFYDERNEKFVTLQ